MHSHSNDRWCLRCRDWRSQVAALALSMLSMVLEAAAITMLVGALAACVSIVPTPGPGGEGCAAACANLDRLGCGFRTSAGPDELAGTPDDQPCLSWCPAYEREGVDLRTSCVSAAATCDEASACPGGGGL